MIKALLLFVSEKKNFKVFLLCSYLSNLWPSGRGPIWPQGHHTKYQSSAPSSFREENFEVFLFPSLSLCFKLVTSPPPPPRGRASFDPRGIRRCYIPNIKPLHLLVSEKKNFEVSIFVPMFWTCDSRSETSFDPRGIIWTLLVQVH